MLGRRHLLALLAAVTIVGATATFAVEARDRTGLAASDRHEAAVTAAGGDRPAALAARPRDSAQLVIGDMRPLRVTGLLAALGVLVVVALQPGHRQVRRSTGAGRPPVTGTRVIPARAPPGLRLITT